MWPTAPPRRSVVPRARTQRARVRLRGQSGGFPPCWRRFVSTETFSAGACAMGVADLPPWLKTPHRFEGPLPRGAGRSVAEAKALYEQRSPPAACRCEFTPRDLFPGSSGTPWCHRLRPRRWPWALSNNERGRWRCIASARKAMAFPQRAVHVEVLEPRRRSFAATSPCERFLQPGWASQRIRLGLLISTVEPGDPADHRGLIGKPAGMNSLGGLPEALARRCACGLIVRPNGPAPCFP